MTNILEDIARVSSGFERQASLTEVLKIVEYTIIVHLPYPTRHIFERFT